MGVDVGGLRLKAVRVGLGARGAPAIEARRITDLRPEDRSEAGILRRVAEVVDDLDPAGHEAVGLAIAGVLRHGDGAVVQSPNFPAWQDFPVAARLEAELGRSVRAENDANAAIWAEVQLGAARGLRTVLGVTLGTGVGGALVLGGRLWRGRHGMAGELGHMPLRSDGVVCGCGSRGCVEQYASTSFLRRESLQRGLDGGFGDRPSRIGRELAAAARRGDVAALELFVELGRHLGVILAGTVNLLDPEAVVVAGGLVGAWDLFGDALERTIRERAFAAMAEDLRVIPGALGDEAGALGAALLALQGACPEGPSSSRHGPLSSEGPSSTR